MTRPKAKGLKPAPRRTRPAQPKPAAAAAAPIAAAPVTQPAANRHRGEHELVLAGVTYRLRPSREAVIAAEQRAGGSLIELARAGNAGALTIPQQAAIARELIHAGADDDVTRMISAERLQELIYEQGVGRTMPRLTMCLLDAANGGRDAAGNVKAAAE